MAIAFTTYEMASHFVECVMLNKFAHLWFDGSQWMVDPTNDFQA